VVLSNHPVSVGTAACMVHSGQTDVSRAVVARLVPMAPDPCHKEIQHGIN
jgi:hypothetical protein